MNSKFRASWVEVIIIGFLIGLGGVWVGFRIEQAIFIAGTICVLINYLKIR